MGEFEVAAGDLDKFLFVELRNVLINIFSPTIHVNFGNVLSFKAVSFFHCFSKKLSRLKPPIFIAHLPGENISRRIPSGHVVAYSDIAKAIQLSKVVAGQRLLLILWRICVFEIKPDGRDQLEKLFTELNDRIEQLNRERRAFPTLVDRILENGGKLENFI
jgi:hypothetical protein